MTTAGVLLAAGSSRRFGAADKLLANLWGRPLASHAAAALSGAGCDLLIGVAADPEVAALLDGFDVVRPEPGRSGQSDSLRSGIARARACGADQALVVLADMPFVTSAHLRAVLDRAGAAIPAASTDGHRRMPPACFPASTFGRLLALSGDNGARALLSGLSGDALVMAAEGVLRDIDTPEDLALARRDKPAD